MLNGLYIIHRESGSLLFEKTYEESSVDTDLFSSLLTAIRSFIAEIHMGELTSFTTHNKKITISLSENVVVALILESAASQEKYQGIAYELGHQFDKVYGPILKVWNGNRGQFTPFKENLSMILQTKQDPFVVQVAKWATKEFGGEIHIDQELITSSGEGFLVNLIIDRGKSKDLMFREKLLNKFYKGYDRDIFFFKVQEDIIGLNDIDKFIESCKDLGYECHQKERCEHYFDYFPSKIIILAPNFSPTALEKIAEITEYDEKQSKHFIVSNQVGKHMRAAAKKGKVPMLRCNVELWTWQTPYPERIFS